MPLCAVQLFASNCQLTHDSNLTNYDSKIDWRLESHYRFQHRHNACLERHGETRPDSYNNSQVWVFRSTLNHCNIGIAYKCAAVARNTSVTAGNSSGMNDGAAALVLVEASRAASLRFVWALGRDLQRCSSGRECVQPIFFRPVSIAPTSASMSDSFIGVDNMPVHVPTNRKPSAKRCSSMVLSRRFSSTLVYASR